MTGARTEFHGKNGDQMNAEIHRGDRDVDFTIYDDEGCAYILLSFADAHRLADWIRDNVPTLSEGVGG